MIAAASDVMVSTYMLCIAEGIRERAEASLWYSIVSRDQTLFRTEGKGLAHGHRGVCCPAPRSAYQSQHSIQSHDT